MDGSVSRKRPWLAAVLGVFATGLGHVYLRRLRRAAGWLVALLGVSFLFVDEAALTALVSDNPVDPLAVAPVVFVGALSVIDAYLVARAHNAVARITATPDGAVTHCPSCGRELDPSIDFCHWCTTDLSELELRPVDAADESDD
ncbi:zinc ribbon domain-containing protein [Halosimplex pelagicum]|uniref:Zinc ribbon domain-containing protein n=1 Tax=Halosimplex pelagicum TaxID=869886 RepID=A0A7D5PC15_9EURY|nr:zinc ribbon domain-containing protein [Halosimplex pelagicum]QLH84641.1 zinc ribbon domain-containing protein [Halosimplex pelagicum]